MVSQVGRRRHQAAGGKVFQTQRVILGSGMQVGERRVAGVAGLGKQGEIGQLEFRGQFGAPGLLALPRLREPSGIGEAGKKEHDEQGEEPCRQSREARSGGHRAWRMAARRSSTGAP